MEPTESAVRIEPGPVWGKLLAANIEHRRRRLGWSYEELARRAWISLETARQVAKGASDPRLSTVEAIAKALGVLPSELLSEDYVFVEEGDLERDRRPTDRSPTPPYLTALRDSRLAPVISLDDYRPDPRRVIALG